tara:strand:- start:258 stop:497 length:240 start_codon:yes stop_codon:yes gene_type:complete
MDTVHINTPEELEVDCIKLQKMAFIFNAVQSGWKVSMKDDTYVFTKKHEGKKEIYLDTYVKSFIEKNMDINKMKDTIGN